MAFEDPTDINNLVISTATEDPTVEPTALEVEVVHDSTKATETTTPVAEVTTPAPAPNVAPVAPVAPTPATAAAPVVTPVVTSGTSSMVTPTFVAPTTPSNFPSIKWDELPEHIRVIARDLAIHQPEILNTMIKCYYEKDVAPRYGLGENLSFQGTPTTYTAPDAEAAKAERYRKEAMKNIVDAGILSQPGISKLPISQWKNDVISIGKLYPFRGIEAINLLRKVVVDEMRHLFYETFESDDPPDEPLSYFVDLIVEAFNKNINPRRIMRELLNMSIDSQEDSQQFCSQFEQFLADSYTKKQGLDMYLARLSEENFQVIDRDPTITTLSEVSAWALRHLPVKSRKRFRDDNGGDRANKKVHKKFKYKCGFCKSNSHLHSQCSKRKNQSNSSTYKNKGSQ